MSLLHPIESLVKTEMEERHGNTPGKVPASPVDRPGPKTQSSPFPGRSIFYQFVAGSPDANRKAVSPCFHSLL